MSRTLSQIVGSSVLLVDSHADSLFLTTAVLQHLQLSVIPVASVRQAIQALQRFDPDILISELRLPDEDGYALMRKVKAHYNGRERHLPAIALTTQTSDEAKTKALAAGFCRYLTKPYQIDTLAEVLLQLSDASTQALGNCRCCA